MLKPSPNPQSMEKLSSKKLIPGAKKIGVSLIQQEPELLLQTLSRQRKRKKSFWIFSLHILQSYSSVCHQSNFRKKQKAQEMWNKTEKEQVIFILIDLRAIQQTTAAGCWRCHLSDRESQIMFVYVPLKSQESVIFILTS